MHISRYEQVKQELMQQPKRWLVTGVAGFIGSNLLEQLLKLDQTVIGIDNFATGSQANIDDALSQVSPQQQQRFHFTTGDICSLDDCRNAVEGVDYILHQAALGSIPRSIKTPEITHATNSTGLLNMLIAAKDANIRRFVFASSSSVYGDSPDLPKREEKIGNPLSPYAASKYTNELYAKAFSACYQIETIGLRYFNVFGPRQNINGPYAAVIARWVSSLLRNEPIFINGDGETSRDFCYVANAVQANILAAVAQQPEAINRVYNVAVGEQNTLKKLYELILSNLNLAKAPEMEYREFRPADIRHSLANIDNAKNLLGYAPTHRLHEGLGNMMDWYKAKVAKAS